MTASTRVRALCLVLLAVLLAGCAGRMANQPSSPAAAARRAAAGGHYERAAGLYQRAAANAASAGARRRLRLAAALAAAQAGDARMAKPILDRINPDALNAAERARYRLARTEVRIAGMTPARALRRLPPPARGAPATVAQRTLAKRAALHFANHQPIAGIHSLARRDVWLTNKRAIRANDNRIYNKSLDAIALGLGPKSRPAANAGATTRGWLALAAIGQRRYASRAARDRALAQWQKRYPRHPANRDVLASRFHYHRNSAPPVAGPKAAGPGPGAAAPTGHRIALALPLSGQFSSAARAIRDGFMFAYHNSARSNGPPQVYDTAALGARGILQRAQNDGAGVLVGPLDKPKVAAMARQNSRIPILALNDTKQPVARAGFYQFSLSPKNDAAAVARHALDMGYRRALALVPRGDWGQRTLDGFRARFTQAGGRLLDYATYDDRSHDHSAAIKQLLAGYRQNPNSVDFIFVAARPVQGRLIHSQLRYYHASKLPMLSTSQVYSGRVNAAEDIDLNGVHFADMPWILGHGPTISRRRKAADQRFGAEASDYARLFAMGMDAWLLAGQITGPGLHPGATFEGMTGVLTVRPDGRIARRLAWAVFRHGRPKLLAMPATTAANIASKPPGARR